MHTGPPPANTLTLKELGCSIWRTATERVKLRPHHKLVAETEVGNLDVHVIVKQQILSL